MDNLPKKSLGQHWLNDRATLESIVTSASIQPDELVLEIGPGQGALTEQLAKAGAQVQALEFDENLIAPLQKKFDYVDDQMVQVEQGDIRSFDFNRLDDTYKIVANIPYYLTANLLRLLTEPSTHKPSKAVLLMQKEVAQRVAAAPGSMAFLSVAVQFYYEVSLGMEVPAELFTPPPKVNSQVLIMAKRQQPLFDVEAKDFLRFVKICFAQRRKTLLNNIASGLRVNREQAQAWAGQAGVDPGRRPQTLSLEEWRALYHAAHA